MTHKILIVDDAEIMLLLIQKFVSSLGHQTLLAANGQLAVDAYKAERPDLVLMDMMMPVMDGIVATQKLRADFPAPACFVPVLGLTANVSAAALTVTAQQVSRTYDGTTAASGVSPCSR